MCEKLTYNYLNSTVERRSGKVPKLPFLQNLANSVTKLKAFFSNWCFCLGASFVSISIRSSLIWFKFFIEVDWVCSVGLQGLWCGNMRQPLRISLLQLEDQEKNHLKHWFCSWEAKLDSKVYSQYDESVLTWYLWYGNIRFKAFFGSFKRILFNWWFSCRERCLI